MASYFETGLTFYRRDEGFIDGEDLVARRGELLRFISMSVSFGD